MWVTWKQLVNDESVCALTRTWSEMTFGCFSRPSQHFNTFFRSFKKKVIRAAMWHLTAFFFFLLRQKKASVSIRARAERSPSVFKVSPWKWKSEAWAVCLTNVTHFTFKAGAFGKCALELNLPLMQAVLSEVEACSPPGILDKKPLVSCGQFLLLYSM